MAIYAFFEPTSFISSAPGGYSFFASAAFGSNGSQYLTPELAVGSQQATVNGRVQWDNDLSDGLDSDDRSFSFEADLETGAASFQLGDQISTPSNSTSAGGSIGSIFIRTGASVAGLAAFGSLQISFFKNGVFQESLDVSGEATADATNSDTGAAEQILVVTPGGTDYDSVAVTGRFWMQAGEDIYPGWTDLFGEILVLPAI
jgi:hypothetical protein